MKKHILLATAVMVGFGAFAQSSLHLNTPKPTTKPTIAFNKEANHQMKSALTCGNDTTFYSYLKEETLGTSSYFIVTADNPITEYSQSFLNTGSLTVKGISFWGGVQDVPNPAQTITANVILYNVDATFKPTTVIATQSILLNTTIEIKTAMFSVPQTVTGNYAVAIQNTSTTDTIAIITNNAETTSYDEGLAFVKAPAFGGWFATSAAFAAPGAYEAIITPIVSYTITSNYTMSPAPTTMCLGTPLTFTNTTTPTAILGNRMYNYQAYTAYWTSTPDSIYAWDMGDGSPLQWTTNAAYTYPAAGLDTVTLFTLGGLFTSCLDTKSTYLDITPNAVSSFTQNTTASPLIAFTSTSTGAVTYSWDFGDGSPTDNTMNPTHTFGVGTWTVTLTVTSAGACNSSVTTQTVTVITTGIATATTGVFNVYPNPSATGVFTIDMIAASKANIDVYNTIGELVYSTIHTNAATSLDLSSLSAGVYTMKVNSNNQQLIKQIVITK
jgi:Secretion system C-terminal sorting domain/PKD domain